MCLFADACGLIGEHMQALACEFTLSETSLVLPPATCWRSRGGTVTVAASRTLSHVVEIDVEAAGIPSLGGSLPLYLYAWHGVMEDPATGSAATALVSLLLSLAGGERLLVEIVQGIETGRPSLLHVAAHWTGDVPVFSGHALV